MNLLKGTRYEAAGGGGGMMDDTDAAIASNDWMACETCANFDDADGCTLKHIDVELHPLGDWILCVQYEPRLDGE